MVIAALFFLSYAVLAIYYVVYTIAIILCCLNVLSCFPSSIYDRRYQCMLCLGW